jgi:hypothetical protein
MFSKYNRKFEPNIFFLVHLLRHWSQYGMVFHTRKSIHQMKEPRILFSANEAESVCNPFCIFRIEIYNNSIQ